MSKGIFESQALSYQNKDKQISSTEKEQKRLERLRRKERKLNEKLKAKREEERQNRKRERMKLRLQDVKRDQIDELQDDMLNFKDSDRESVLSYFVKNGYSNDFAALDTPTRLLNKSNDFLPLAYDEKLKQAIEEMDRRQNMELE